MYNRLVSFVAVSAIWLFACGGSSGQDDRDGSVAPDASVTDAAINPNTDAGPADPIAGWSDFTPVVSDGSHTETDIGSRIAYVDAATGSDDTGVYYWWNGSQVVDAEGNEYGSDPMNPTGPIAAFASWSPAGAWGRGDEHYLSENRYPDWLLFRRGQDHALPADQSLGYPIMQWLGRSREEPALLGAYGALEQARPRLTGSFSYCTCGDPKTAFLVVTSAELALDAEQQVSLLPMIPDAQFFPDDEPFVLDNELLRSWFWFEDVLIKNTNYGIALIGIADLTLFRSVVTEVFSTDNHNQGLFVAFDQARVHVEESIFYRNGLKSDPSADPNPARDIFSRNFYLGGGSERGVTLRNVISAAGGSGGPQMRFGGYVEDSLIIEGYWFTSTMSSGSAPSWLAQDAQTYHFRNNVQLVMSLPAPNLPAPVGETSDIAHTGSGFAVFGASTGVFEDNIISGAMLRETGFTDYGRWDSGIQVTSGATRVDGALVYTGNNVIRDNIMYEVAGLLLNTGSDESDAPIPWSTVAGTIEFRNNAWYDSGGASGLWSTVDTEQKLEVTGNTFYTDRAEEAFQNGSFDAWDHGAVKADNTVAARASAPWSDPNRSLKTYTEEVLGLPVTSVTGMPEFFAEATRMRKGYWRQELTARAVVNYIRAGFDLPALKGE